MQNIREESLDSSERTQIRQFLATVSKEFTSSLPGNIANYFYFTLMDYDLETKVMKTMLLNIINKSPQLSFEKHSQMVENLCAYHKTVKKLRTVPGNIKDVTADFCYEQMESIEKEEKDNPSDHGTMDPRGFIPRHIIEKFEVYSEEKAIALAALSANTDKITELDEAVDDYRVSVREQEKILGDIATEKFNREREEYLKQKEETELKHKELREQRQKEFENYLKEAKKAKAISKKIDEKQRREREKEFNKQIQKRIESQKVRKQALGSNLEEQFKRGVEQRRRAREMDRIHSAMTRKRIEESFRDYRENNED